MFLIERCIDITALYKLIFIQIQKYLVTKSLDNTRSFFSHSLDSSFRRVEAFNITAITDRMLFGV
jgi:hypothetical protein